MTRSEAEALLGSFTGARDRARELTVYAFAGSERERQAAAESAIRESHNARERVIKALMASNWVDPLPLATNG